MMQQNPMMLWLASALLCVVALMPMTDARSLRDLIQREPELYMPSQLIAGQEAVFTVKAKPGENVKVIVSSQSEGRTLPNGTPMRVGRSHVSKIETVPASGVLTMSLLIPERIGPVGAEKYVDGYVWRLSDKSDARLLKVVQSTGAIADNVVLVAEPYEAGGSVIMPGDPSMANVIRTMTTLGEVQGDERKKRLIDDGTINRERQLDRVLTNPAAQSNTGFQF